LQQDNVKGLGEGKTKVSVPACISRYQSCDLLLFRTLAILTSGLICLSPLDRFPISKVANIDKATADLMHEFITTGKMQILLSKQAGFCLNM